MSARRTDSGLDGILAIDKPAGWTSHDIVAKVRGIVRQRRIGHTGTLDPMATGLLVLCLGQGTRLVEYMTGHDKRYTGQVTLGVTTTTDDAEGEVIASRPAPELSAERLEAALEAFRGPILQRPPAFSALKIDGRRAYDLARKGEVPELQPRPVTVRSFVAHQAPGGLLEIEVDCSAGTYVRSLARDLGEALGCGAHLSALRRTRVGSLNVEDATTLEGLQAAVSGGRLDELLLAIDEGVASMDAVILSPDGAAALSNGGAWEAGNALVRPSDCSRVYDLGGEFSAVASVSSLGEIRPLKVFQRGKSAKL